MNRTLPEVLHCLNNQATINIAGGADVSVLERQHARMKWQQDLMHLQQQQQQQPPQHQSGYFSGSELSMFSLPAQDDQQFQGLMGNLDDLMNRAVKPDPGLENNGWPDFGKFDDHQLGYYGANNVPGFDMHHTLMRMASCPPAMAAIMAETEVCDVKGTNSSPVPGRENTKKRKPDKTQNLKVLSEEDDRKDDKKIKSCTDDEDSKFMHLYSNKNNKTVNENNTTNSRENSADATSKEKSKAEVQKTDYIHVRARRGQATDSHSLAERVRREKISERMKYLQDLVPGCNKITGKAGMLDEIINYVQSLQRQVEFLSMKLAAVNPRLDFNMDNFITKEMFPSSTAEFSMIGGVSSEMANQGFLQLSPLQQMVSCCGMEMGINPADMALRRTISAPVSVPESFIDSSCFNQQIQPQTTWDATAITNLYGIEFQQGTSTTFASQQFTGSHQGGNLKMEM